MSSLPYWWSDRLEELYDLATHVRGEAFVEVESMIVAELCLTSTLHLAVKLSGGDPLTLTGGIFTPWRHIVYLCQKLDALERRELDHRNLLVTMPPQYGKSTTCSKHFPTRHLARRPEEQILLTSYEDQKAERWGRRVRDQIGQASEFLGIAVSPVTSAAKRWELVGHMGGMQTAGIGGPLTGEPGDLIIIDDPVKNAKDAASVTMQDDAWDWYTDVVHTRRQTNTIKLLIQTRWNENDLAGRILEEEGDAWEVVNLPALAEADDALGREIGEPLCPEKYSLEDLEHTRTLMRSSWSALYQQAPSPEEGAEFKRSTFRYFEPYEADEAYYRLHAEDSVELVKVADCFRFTTMDLADTTKKRSDWTVIATWDLVPKVESHDDGRRRPARLLLVDVQRVRVEGDVHLPLIKDTEARFKPRWHGVEKQYLGRQLIKRAIREGLHMHGLDADRDKTARSETARQWLVEGRVYFKRGAGWLPAFERELLVFPNGKHDDQVDVFSYACEEADRLRGLKKRLGGSKTRERMRRRNQGPARHPILGKA